MEALVFYEVLYEDFVGEPVGDAGGERIHLGDADRSATSEGEFGEGAEHRPSR